MRCTTLVSIATLFLLSCKVVQIDKQPIRTTVENTPTVNVGNFPAPTGGTGNVNANITNTNPIPVKIENSAPVIVKPATGEDRSVTVINATKVEYTVLAGHSAVIEYLNFTTKMGGNPIAGVLSLKGRSIYIGQENSRYGSISEKVYIPLNAGEKIIFSGINASGFPAEGTALMGIRVWKNE